MNAIFSYKICDRFWKPRGDYFYKLALLSVEYAKKYYNTVLYSDKNTREVFTENGIIFDDYVTSETLLANVNEHNYGMAKLLAFQEQSSNYVALDLDTLIIAHINPSSTVTYGYKEIDLTEGTEFTNKIAHVDYVKEYYWACHDFFKPRIPEIEKYLDWTTFPSNSLIYVQNPEVVKEVSKDILDRVGKDYRMLVVQYYEQFMLYSFLKHYKVDIDFIYNTVPNPEPGREHTYTTLASKKFLHLDSYYRNETIRGCIGILYEQLTGKKIEKNLT